MGRSPARLIHFKVFRLWAAAQPIEFLDAGLRPGPAYRIFEISRPGPARSIIFSKFSTRPGRAHHMFKILGPARPGPSQFSDRPGPAWPGLDHRPMTSPEKSTSSAYTHVPFSAGQHLSRTIGRPMRRPVKSAQIHGPAHENCRAGPYRVRVSSASLLRYGPAGPARPNLGPAHQRRPMTSPDLSSHHDVKLDRWFRFFRHFVKTSSSTFRACHRSFFSLRVFVFCSPGYTSPALRSTPISIRAQSYFILSYFLDKLSFSRPPSILSVISSVYDRLIDDTIPGTRHFAPRAAYAARYACLGRKNSMKRTKVHD